MSFIKSDLSKVVFSIFMNWSANHYARHHFLILGDLVDFV